MTQSREAGWVSAPHCTYKKPGGRDYSEHSILLVAGPLLLPRSHCYSHSSNLGDLTAPLSLAHLTNLF